MAFHTQTLLTWADLDRLGDVDWVYRGQPDAGDPLRSSLERLMEDYCVPSQDRPGLESEILREFQRAYHLCAAQVPAESDTLEWLSLMRHHGAPTRLLDFSYSKYVAAYFALERSKDYCAIWAIDSHWALAETTNVARRARKRRSTFPPGRIAPGDQARFIPFFMKPPFVPAACAMNPYRLNERLRIQKGVFMIPSDVRIPFEQNLTQMADHDRPEHLVKVVIPRNLQLEGLKQLYYMNISRASLFPGLDGYASSLGVFQPYFNRLV